MLTQSTPFSECRYLMRFVLFLFLLSPLPGFSTESVMFELRNGIHTSIDMIWQPGDPYYYVSPILFRISRADLVQNATITLDLNPFTPASIRKVEDSNPFSSRLEPIEAGLVQVVLTRTQPSTPTVRDCTFDIVSDRYVRIDFGNGFGPLRFKDVQVDIIDNRDVQIITKDGSWFYVTDYGAGFELNLLSALTGNPIEGARVTLMGMEDLPELFYPGLAARQLTGAPGRYSVEFNAGCVGPLFYNLGHAIDLDFILWIEPPEGSGINPQTIIVRAYPIDPSGNTSSFQPVTVIIGPTSDVPMWAWLR